MGTCALGSTVARSAEAHTNVRERAAGHWAFQPLRRPALPILRDASSQVASPIDAFLASRLSSAGLAIGPIAERRLLLRRAAFLITGLPPSPQDVDRFNSSTQP